MLMRHHSLFAAAVLVSACGPTGAVDSPWNIATPTELGLVVDGTWRLDDNNDGVWDGCAVDRCVVFGSVTDIPLAGDWQGDGVDSWGAHNRKTATFTLATRGESLSFVFGARGDIPLAGDWDGDGVDTVGVFTPSTATFALKNANAAGAPDLTFVFGLPGDIPFAGDWDGDGRDEVGVFRQAESRFLLRGHAPAPAVSFIFGDPGDLPLIGDWNDDRIDTIGVYSSSTGEVALKDELGASSTRVLRSGVVGAKPVSGRWQPRE
jgi:hypothetical protein